MRWNINGHVKAIEQAWTDGVAFVVLASQTFLPVGATWRSQWARKYIRCRKRRNSRIWSRIGSPTFYCPITHQRQNSWKIYTRSYMLKWNLWKGCSTRESPALRAHTRAHTQTDQPVRINCWTLQPPTQTHTLIVRFWLPFFSDWQ